MFTGSLLKRFAWSGTLLLSLITMTALTLRAEDPAPEDAPVAAQTDTASADQPAPIDPSEDQPAGAPAEDAAVSTVVASDISLEKNKSNSNAFLTFSLVIGIIVLSWYLSLVFAKKWRVPNSQSRYFIVLLCFLAALASTILGLKQHRANLGIDLKGGSILVYGVQPIDSDAEKGVTAISDDEMSKLKAALARRINPAGVKEISIQELGGNTEVKITIPEADEAEVARNERIINSAGHLKFRILSLRDSAEEEELVRRALAPENASLKEIRLEEPIGKKRQIIGGSWLPVDPTEVNRFLLDGSLILRDMTDPTPLLLEAAKKEGQKGIKEIFCLELDDLYNVQGEQLQSVREGVGERGLPEVRFSMNDSGAERMKNLTDYYKAGKDRSEGRQMAIVLNDCVFSAPAIRATISRDGVITLGGDNSSAESIKRIQNDVRDLISVMNAGSLPAKLTDNPVTKMVTGPTLGEDTIKKGMNSVLYGGILVLVFMIGYYGFAGFVASFAVIMNLLMIMAVMFGLRAAFTLPGLAGLVLTVGMAVDANVLIFERIKEELGGGATLKMAISNGFQRAFTAIFDSNITTMITAIILYAVGTDQVKGFAVTLFFGVAFSLFTATYVSRIIFETAEVQKWIGNRCVFPILPGLKPFKKTNFDFVAKQKTVFICAMTVILIGLVGVVCRGKGIFDIDFIGGVEVQAIFDEPQEIGDIRAKLSDLKDLSVSSVQLSKDRNGEPVPAGCCFNISTSCPVDRESEDYRDEVEQLLHNVFGDVLRHLVMTVGSVEGTTSEHVAGEDVTKITVGMTINPPVAREVVEGYFSDAAPAFLEANQLSDLKFEVVGHDANEEQDLSFSDWSVSFQTDNEQTALSFMNTVEGQVTGRSLFESSQTIGSSVAGYARTQGILAIIGSLICIILYIWFRFKRAVFGLAAVLALFHDVLVTLGLIALSVWLAPFLGFLGVSEFKIGLSTVAAFLTIIGYSLNDTIVLFDRMREICGRNQPIDSTIVNRAINQTLSRTILTSLTTLFVALVLYFFGGNGIHTFSFAMSVGVVVGTFSSIFVASPLVLWMLKSKRM